MVWNLFIQTLLIRIFLIRHSAKTKLYRQVLNSSEALQ